MEMDGRREVYIGMTDILDGLNESQKQAVVSTDTHLLVVAGPGTGKTLTIVRRIAHLLQQGVSSDQIIALTFTNRAARQMRERIESYSGIAVKSTFIGTFHHLGLRLMRENLDEEFTVCTREDQLTILKSIAGSAAKAQASLEKISRVKNRMEEPDMEDRYLYSAYETALRRERWRDFDDLISIPVELFKANRVKGLFSNARTFIIVDEYQDISPAQYNLLRCMVGAHPLSMLCAVGDSDQAIYGFRGADIQNFLAFGNDFSDAATVVLSENYRSTKTVLSAADRLIKNNARRVTKELHARREQGKPIAMLAVHDQRAEAEYIVQEIEHRVGGTSHFRLAGNKGPRDFAETSYGFSDFGVLFRTNAQAGALREAFEEWGIPCQLVGERHASSRKLLVEKLRAQMDALPESDGLAELLKTAADEAGVSLSDRGLLETVAAAYQYLPVREALVGMINELALLTSADAYDPRADAVTLMSLHMAKGLEFKVVFIVGCEEGLIPLMSVNAGKGEPDIEEERRLFYVGMTRAEDELYLLHARERFLYGRRLTRTPSRFLSEIPEGLVRSEILQQKRKKTKPPSQPGLF